MTEQPNNNPDSKSEYKCQCPSECKCESECKCPPECKCKSKTFYLKEALRLSELQLAEHSGTFVTIERKAILLVTLYIVIIAYLLSWVGNSNEKVTTMMILISFVIILILIIAAWISALALHARYFGTPGAEPKYLKREDFKQNFNNMAKDLLNHYDEISDLNNKMLDKKLAYLELSMRLGTAGIVLTCIWIFLVFCYKLGIMP